MYLALYNIVCPTSAADSTLLHQVLVLGSSKGESNMSSVNCTMLQDPVEWADIASGVPPLLAQPTGYTS